MTKTIKTASEIRDLLQAIVGGEPTCSRCHIGGVIRIDAEPHECNWAVSTAGDCNECASRVARAIKRLRETVELVRVDLTVDEIIAMEAIASANAIGEPTATTPNASKRTLARGLVELGSDGRLHVTKAGLEELRRLSGLARI